MNRFVLMLIVLGVLVLAVSQMTYAQGPLAYYGHLPPASDYSYPSPYALNYLGGGVYLAEPFAPPGYMFSQSYLGFPLSADVSSYTTGPYGTGSYANGPFLNGDYSRGRNDFHRFVGRYRLPGF